MARTRLYPPSVDPGFPELPETPPGWRQTTFGEVLEVVERPVKLDPDKTYRLVNAKRSRGGITLRNELPGREILTKTQFEAKAGDFLISRRQIIHGACGVVPDDLDGAVVSNEYSTLKPRPALSLDFLRHYSHTPYFQRTCFHSSHGVDVEKMIFKIAEWLVRRMDLPPLPEQRKIASILSSVDDAIESTQAVIGQLGVLKKAMMAELLTRGLPGRHTRFKQTEIGEVPEDWEIVPLGNLVEVVGGFAFPRELQRGRAGTIPFVKCSDMNSPGNERVQMEAAECVDDELLRKLKAKVYPRDTIIFPKVGAALLTNKRRILGRPASFDNNVMGLLPGHRVASKYLFYVMQTVDFAEHVQPGAVPSVNAGLVKALPIPVPPYEEAERIANLLWGVDDRSEAERRTTEGAARLKSALMSVLLTGEVRVKPDEDAA